MSALVPVKVSALAALRALVLPKVSVPELTVTGPVNEVLDSPRVSALLLVFFISCGFGALLACSLAYDWNLPGDSFYWMRTWHVNAGIFMLVTGAVHFSRRFHFFLKPPHGRHN